MMPADPALEGVAEGVPARSGPVENRGRLQGRRRGSAQQVQSAPDSAGRRSPAPRQDLARLPCPDHDHRRAAAHPRTCRSSPTRTHLPRPRTTPRPHPDGEPATSAGTDHQITGTEPDTRVPVDSHPNPPTATEDRPPTANPPPAAAGKITGTEPNTLVRRGEPATDTKRTPPASVACKIIDLRRKQRLDPLESADSLDVPAPTPCTRSCSAAGTTSSRGRSGHRRDDPSLRARAPRRPIHVDAT